MKYIRTKEGIVTDKLYEHALEFCALTYENAQKSDLKILKQSDNLEELCDVFLIVRKDDIGTVSDLKTLKEMLSQRNCDIEFEVEDDYFYIGAIFTDKGIIYKAKMKGILPNGEIDWELL